MPIVIDERIITGSPVISAPPAPIEGNTCEKCGQPCLFNLCAECTWIACFRAGML